MVRRFFAPLLLLLAGNRSIDTAPQIIAAVSRELWRRIYDSFFSLSKRIAAVKYKSENTFSMLTQFKSYVCIAEKSIFIP